MYLTPNLYINNKITYYCDDETNKIKIITAGNWHKYLSEYGWEKLDYGWIRRFNCYNKEKNSRWGLLDCGGDGDCLFHVIAEAMMEPDMQNIRKMAANEINENNFDIIIEVYRIAFDNNDFINDWNPHKIKNKEDLKRELIKEGDNYWGDHIVLQLLEKALDINFIILNSEKLGEYGKKINGILNKRFNIHNICSILDYNRKTIIIYYIDSTHFKLVGYFNTTYMQTLFDELPNEIIAIYREDCRE